MTEWAKQPVAAIRVSAVAILAVLLASAASAPALAEPVTSEVRVLAISDFHGRIEPALSSTPPQAGAALIAGAVDQIRAEHPSTVFVSAGDNIGASTFASFIADDAPTVDSLAASGLDVSAVGNHEFDRGYENLRDRVLPAYGGDHFGLGANVYLKADSTPALAEYSIVESGGVRIGFIGTVTEQTATSVTPTFISELEFGSQLEAANRVAAEIDDQVDITVLLAHDGSFSSDCSTIESEQSVFGELIRQAAPSQIDAIVSGHTHTPYSCTIHGRPVIQPGHYGSGLAELIFTLDEGSGDVVAAAASILPLVDTGAPLYSRHPLVADIVTAAVANADVRGAEPVGSIAADILRGGTPPGSDRGVESALGNLVADIMLDAMRLDGVPIADIAIMNPGGLREDLLYGEDGIMTYRDAANVLPFANSLFTVDLTGEQLRQLLEQQWYSNEGTLLKRHLSLSAGFTYRYNPDKPRGSRVLSMELHGQPIEPNNVYTVVTHTFLIAGGDGFTVFSEGGNVTDTGRNDLQITVEYFADHPDVQPPALGRAVRVAEPPTPQPTPQPLPSPGRGEGKHFDNEELAVTGIGGQHPIELLVLGAVLGFAGVAAMTIGQLRRAALRDGGATGQ